MADLNSYSNPAYPDDFYSDQLNIDTPEQVELHLPIAGLGSRFLALACDVLIHVGAYLILFFVLFVFAVASRGMRTSTSSSSGSHLSAAWVWAIFILINFLIQWGYFTLFEGLWHGQTPGKRILKIRVIKDSGRSINFFEALTRNLVRIVDMQLLYLVGCIAMMCNREQKRLGDLAAGTIVIHERTDEQPLLNATSRTFTSELYPQAPLDERLPLRSLQPLAQAAADGESQIPADIIARLKPADLDVIETFFNRALDFTVERRAELAARVAAQMCARMGIPLPEGAKPERLLETIAHQMRSVR